MQVSLCMGTGEEKKKFFRAPEKRGLILINLFFFVN
jgi:hypothetical protein